MSAFGLPPADRFAEDASWAVPASICAQSAKVVETPYGFRTSALDVKVDRLGLRISDANGHPILNDAGKRLSLDGPRFSLFKQLRPGERIYGLGDKTGNFDRRGQSFVDWNTDAWGFQRDTDPIYKSIPFYIARGGDGGAYGLFLDNTWRSWFDFGHRDPEHDRDRRRRRADRLLRHRRARPFATWSGAIPT